jgi:hypothetical protein
VAEHQRVAPSVKKAGLAVEAARFIVTAMIDASDPLLGPALAAGGILPWPGGPSAYSAWDVFPEHFAWIWGCADKIPRAGAGTASAPDTAEVIFAELRSFTEPEHLDVLRILDGCVSSSSGHLSIDEASMRERMRRAGLDQPKLGS